MTGPLNLVHAQSMGQAFAADPELTLPEQPRLIPELMICPFGQDGILFAGTGSTEVVRGRSARRLLPRLLPLLDGTRSVSRIHEDLPDLPSNHLHDALSLLFSRGLLEDGPLTDTGSSLPDLVSFLGRYTDVSRCNRNRDEAFARLVSAAVRVIGRTDLCEVVGEQLLASGVRLSIGGTDLAGPDVLSVIISTGDAPVDLATVDEAQKQTGAVFLVRLGASEAYIGPMLLAGVTVCPRCVTRLHPHPQGVPEPSLAELWLSLSAQQILLEITRLAASVVHRGFHRCTVSPTGAMGQDARLTPRMPGCESCGIDGEPWSPDDPRLLAWIYHVGTSMTRRSTLTLKEHQSHYVAANVNLSVARYELLYKASLLLPDPAELPARLCWTDETSPTTRSHLRLGDLSTLLSRMAGEVGHSERRRRIAPTGGNLGSVKLWILARKIDGLDHGAYLYEPSDHSLRFRATFDDDELGACLGTTSSLPDCVVLGAGDLAKCTQKYRAFAYRLVHFDAGVAVAYAHAVSHALGLTVREYADFQLDLPRIFNVTRRWEYPMPTFALGIRTGPCPSEPWVRGRWPTTAARLSPQDYSPEIVARMMNATVGEAPSPTPRSRRSAPPPPNLPTPRLTSLDDVLMARRATRTFSSTPPTGAVLTALVSAVDQVVWTREVAGAPTSFVHPLLLVSDDAEGLPSGIYEPARNQPGTLRRRAAFGPDLAVECTLQFGLASAPASLVMVADLRAALTRRLARGYCDQAVHAGAAIGAAWLAATSHGLIGTAAGGVIADGFRSVAGLDGFNECPLLGLHIGLPVPPNDQLLMR